MGQENLVLSVYANSGSNINLDVEPLIPLLIARSVPTKTVDGTLLFVNLSKWILVFGLS